MTAEDLPLLKDVFPELTADILRLLDPDDAVLIEQVPAMQYHGVCTCAPTCRNLLTAPQGAPAPYVRELMGHDESVVWLSLDPTATAIVAIEVLDGRDLGHAVQRS
ncbi:hypothetical protein ACIRJO_10630 [Streptomyces sp. NPDC102394]|uniref:hypothetical protein n=1 Tax=Streptomyces sp. NPDC102394 TaxID=3366167 RepID=UPI0037F4DEE1